ncbi:MAG: DUF4256 domain-containing protein [Cyclobacteriaceae bacterium]
MEKSPAYCWSLNEMEDTGGEPDVVGLDKKTGGYIFFDCSAESPAGRRSVCYDRAGLESRKEHQPKTSAVDYTGPARSAINFVRKSNTGTCSH